jgi:Ni/Fe-hydrogenase subunit HybB-like protein
MSKTKRAILLFIYAILAALAALGLGVGIVRMIHGLGVATNLSDSYPWGLWIVYDVLFVPFSAGAFMILIVTHFYGRKEYHAIARPVVLAGFLGEVFVVAVLLMDLGRWHQFYSVLIPWHWNVNSFMFQVSLCLTIYMGVMVLEVAPAVLERFNWHGLLRVVKALTVLIAGAGIVLSSLHQSALGSLFLLMPYKLHPLWWTALLPLLFFVSAAFGGLAMAILVTLVSFRAMGRPLKLRLLSDLSRVISIMLGFYLVLKVTELVASGEIGLAFTEGSLSGLFWAEIAIGVIAPMILFAIRRVRESLTGLAAGAACVLTGVTLNRASVALIGLKAPAGATYVPHWMEITIAAAAIAAAILIFTLAVRLLPILPGGEKEDRRLLPAGWPRWAAIPLAGLMVLITVGAVLVLEPAAEAEARKMMPSSPAEQIYAPPNSASCRGCHADEAALREAGADQDELAFLVIEPRPLSSPHGRLGCITCHRGTDGTRDAALAHTNIVVDPAVGCCESCLACHDDLPDLIPGDRLRVPHGRIVESIEQGHLCDVHCSDCHGAVGHGFDPVSGGLICSMTVCIDCHTERNMDVQLADCGACHIGPHDLSADLTCADCHPSPDAWATVEVSVHPEFSRGKHADPACFECHTWPDFQDLRGTTCADCHTSGHQGTTSSDCAKCHQTGVSWALTSPEAIDHTAFWDYHQGQHARVDCRGCHLEGRYLDGLDPDCATCHAPDEDTCAQDQNCTDCHLSDETWSDVK